MPSGLAPTTPALVETAARGQRLSAGQDLPFWKYEGLGNDFVLFELPSEAADEAHDAHGSAARASALLAQLESQAAAICDRRRGIGADGLLLLRRLDEPLSDGEMIVINADGSRAEMCGNGLRCAALWFLNARPATPGALHRVCVRTGAGRLVCEVEVPEDRDGTHPVRRATVRADLGRASSTGTHEVPLAPRTVLHGVDMGNPHAVLFAPEGADLTEMARHHGPAWGALPAFPSGANVEFTRVRPDHDLEVVVWERGAGLTMACGTGAAAAVYAATREGLIPPRARIGVHLPGGRLQIRIDDEGFAEMTGPAHFAFHGTWHLGSHLDR